MPNPSNVKVQLKTVESIEGYSVPAYPITKWECVTVDLPQSRVVSGTTHYIGGIVSSGNSLWFDRSVQGITTSADVVNIGNLRYCPLSNVVSGVTQYANLYVTGATAAIIDSNGNTGDGDIPTHEYNIVQAITAPYGSRNIPSEQAVGNALDFKQHILAAGSCIGITAGGVADTIYVSATRTVAPYGQAVHTQVPTEAAVRDALSATSYNLSNYAYALTDALHTTIINSGYATANWVDSNFLHKGEIVPVDVPYASYGVAGKVKFISGSGLVVTDDEGTVKLGTAGSSTLGGVMVPASSGITLNAETGAISLAAAGVAASNTAATPALGGVRVISNGGLLITTAGDSAGNLYLDSARFVDTSNGSASGTATQPVGGVRVYKSGGIELTNGNIYLKPAPIVSTTTEALAVFSSKRTGGVAVMNTMVNPGAYATSALVPGMKLFYDAMHPEFSVTSSELNWTVTGGSIFIDDVLAITYSYSVGSSISANSSAYIYVHISRSDSSSAWSGYTCTTNPGTDSDTDRYFLIAYIESDATKITKITQIQHGSIYVKSNSGGLQKFIVTKGTGINVTNSGTTKCTVGLSAAKADTIGGVKVPDSHGIALDQAGGISLNEAPIGTDYADAVASKANGVLGGVVVMQYITSAYDASTSGAVVVPTVDAVYRAVQSAGGGGYTKVSQGTGIGVAGASNTSYTITLSAAQAATIGGVMVPNSSGLSLDSSTGSLKLAAATTASLGGVKLKNSISETSPGTSNIIPTESAIVAYVSAHAGTGGGGYEGPFKVTTATVNGTMMVNVAGGYVVTRQLTHELEADSVAKGNNSICCLSGAIVTVGKVVAAVNTTDYKITVSAGGATKVYSRTEKTTNNTIKWTSNTTSVFTRDIVPLSGTTAYSNASGTISAGKVTAVAYSMTASEYAHDVKVPLISAASGGTTKAWTLLSATGNYAAWSSGTAYVYTPEQQVAKNDTVYTNSGCTTVWGSVTSVTSTTTVMPAGVGSYTMDTTGMVLGSQAACATIWKLDGPAGLIKELWAKQLPTGGIWVSKGTDFDGDYYMANDVSGECCIPIAKIDANGIVQQQYGNVMLPESELAKPGQFTIINLTITTTGLSGGKRVYKVGGVECARLGLNVYKVFGVGGMAMECGGMIYGVTCIPDLFTGMNDGDRGMWLNNYAVEYPETDNVSYTEGGATTQLGTMNDALYIAPFVKGYVYEIWMNIGHNAESSNEGWRFVINTTCYENLNPGKWYSVQLAQIVDGTLTQVHSGPIDIRGRWN